MRALVLVAALGGVAFADATVPRATLREKEPIVIEVERPATLVATQTVEAETVLFDTLGFVDASLSSVEPRGGLTVIKRPTMKLRMRRTR